MIHPHSVLSYQVLSYHCVWDLSLAKSWMHRHRRPDVPMPLDELVGLQAMVIHETMSFRANAV